MALRSECFLKISRNCFFSRRPRDPIFLPEMEEKTMTSSTRTRCGQRFTLDGGGVFSLPPSSPCGEIVCTEGVIWVTFTGDPEDYLLSKGERLSTGKKQGAVISGIGRSEFSLVQERPRRLVLTPALS
jgi:hypothetical protein